VKFTVVIPTCHRNELLARCLERLAPGAQTLPAADYEVIVSDDGIHSTARDLVAAKFPWAKWFIGPRRGPAANRNHGVRQGTGDWIAFLDDDCVPDSGWLAGYAQAIAAQPGVRVLEGSVYVDRPRRSLGEASPTNEGGGRLWSCNFAIERRLFQELGGFDERFPYANMEDVDLSFRLRRAGQGFAFVREASVCHPWRPKGGWRALRQHRESLLLYLRLHPEETARLNCFFYASLVARTFLKETLPGVFRYFARGLGQALLEHAAYLHIAVILLFRPRTRTATPELHG
jgi:GT2 family glycosyltransferase